MPTTDYENESLAQLQTLLQSSLDAHEEEFEIMQANYAETVAFREDQAALLATNTAEVLAMHDDIEDKLEEIRLLLVQIEANTFQG